MAHGYLREYDEGWDRGEDRERSERDWRDQPRDQDRERDRRGERDRDFMFGDRDRQSYRDQDRGFFSRMADDARSMFRDDDRQYRQSHSDWNQEREEPRSRHERYGRPSSHTDDHYRSWRDQQMNALDRDYADYCREREQQFHRDFDSWRQNRQQQQPQASQGQPQAQDELILGAEHAEAGGLAAGTESQPVPSGESQATLGTNNPQNSTTGRGRR